MWKHFPTPWSFIFWLIFPVAVAKYTAKFWLEFTGTAMPKEQTDRLRRKLAGVTSDIKEATPTRSPS